MKKARKNQVVGLAEAAAVAGCSRGTVLNAIKAKALKFRVVDGVYVFGRSMLKAWGDRRREERLRVVKANKERLEQRISDLGGE